MEAHKTNKKIPVLAIVMPCYDEDQVLPETIKQLSKVLDGLVQKKKISKESYILCVNDGSRDKTWELIKSLSIKNDLVRGLKLSRNFGHQNALLAGLSSVREKCDCAISVDADLQDDINVIEKFVDSYETGADIVYGVRQERKKDSFFKRTTAQFFYKLMRGLGVDIIYNHADYRLCSQRVLKKLDDFSEVNLFLRGIFPLLGFKSTIVYYSRNKRFAGESKYNLRKMLSFAFDGITSFSIKPLRIITVFGAIVFVASILAAVWVFIELILGRTIHGWASTVIPIYFIGGLQILSLGVIGEYIGKIYKEVKHRPRFIVEEEI